MTDWQELELKSSFLEIPEVFRFNPCASLYVREAYRELHDLVHNPFQVFALGLQVVRWISSPLRCRAGHVQALRVTYTPLWVKSEVPGLS